MKPPIRISVIGGLGNQLHAYVAAFVISREIDREVILDSRWLSWMGSNGSRKCVIHQISVSRYFNPRIIKSLWAIKRGPFRRKLSALVTKIDQRKFSGHLNADQFNSADEILECLRRQPGISSIKGYFSTWDWSDKARQYVDYEPKVLKLNESTFALTLRAEDVIGVHVRLGDYLNHPDVYPIPSEKFFVEAIEVLRKNANDEYWIYTDDLENLNARYPDLVLASKKYLAPMI